MSSQLKGWLALAAVVAAIAYSVHTHNLARDNAGMSCILDGGTQQECDEYVFWEYDAKR